jgi:hypothetical protein
MVILNCPREKSVRIFCLNFDVIHEPLSNARLSTLELLTSTVIGSCSLGGVFSVQVWAVLLIFIAACLVPFVMVVNRTEFTVFATFDRIGC